MSVVKRAGRVRIAARQVRDTFSGGTTFSLQARRILLYPYPKHFAEPHGEDLAALGVTITARKVLG